MSKKDINVVWVTGNFYQRYALIQKIKKSMGSFHYVEFDEEDKLETALLQIKQRACFDEKRLLVFKNWPATKYAKETLIKKISQAIAHIPSDCVVIFDNCETRSKVFEKAIGKVGKVFKYANRISIHEATHYALNYFSDLGKEFNRSDAEELVMSISSNDYNSDTATSIDKLTMLCKKLGNYLGNRKRINPEDIKAVIGGQAEFIIWQLFDAIDTKRYCHCLSLLNSMLVNEKNIQNALIYFVQLMIWRYRMLTCIMELGKQGKDEEQIKAEISCISKLKRREDSQIKRGIRMEAETDDKGKEIPIASEKAIYVALNGPRNKPSVLPNYNRKELLTILLILEQSIVKIRGTTSSTESLLCFESMLMVFCGILSKHDSDFLREEYIY